MGAWGDMLESRRNNGGHVCVSFVRVDEARFSDGTGPMRLEVNSGK